MRAWKLEDNIYISKHPSVELAGTIYLLESGWIGKRKEGIFSEEEILNLYKDTLKKRNSYEYFAKTGIKWIYPDYFMMVIHEEYLYGDKVSLPLFIPTESFNDPKYNGPSWDYYKENQNFYAPMGRYKLIDKRRK